MLPNLRGVFVTGTDTGVGKTWVAANLVRVLHENGSDVYPLKPVESGCTGAPGLSHSALRAEDAEILREAAQLDESESVVLYKLRAPIAPTLAARQEGLEIRLHDLIGFCRRSETLVVEGAGGWKSPLASDGDVQALALALGLPVLVVAEDRLGAINHTMLTCESVRQSGCRLAGIILNRLKPGTEDFGNLPELERHLAEMPIWQTGYAQWLAPKEERHVLTTFMPEAVS